MTTELASDRPGAADPRRLAAERVQRAVSAFQRGDRDQSFRVLFESYYRPLQRFFARKGFSPEACSDLTQETLLGIYKGLETYRPEARFETWLYKIATTTYLKSWRSRSTAKRSGEEVSTEEVEPSLGVSSEQLDAMLQSERRRALRQAVDELPEQMRRCLKLRIYQERSYREIAAALQVSVDTVKAHLFQGRKRLRQRLAAAGK